ncbi:hypothetical protein Tco_0875805 [Tanacetum coccineum]|uniref:Uncharacterized protein n=1 Tax=Tanacetum coccineum TaxID=301880 RepID=A0ABQ5BVH8_9ASTR
MYLNPNTFDVAYDRAYRDETKRIQSMVLKKQLAEVELFIMSESPLNDAIKGGWTYEMIEFYEASIAENKQNGNEFVKRMKVGDAMDDEVAMTDTSTQDEVKLLIYENRLSMCAVIETSLNKKIVNSACDDVFESWYWLTNSVDRKNVRV